MTLPPPEKWPVDAPDVGESVDLLRLRAESTPDRTAILDADRGEAWAYAEFDRRVDRLAARMERLERLERRERSEDRVGILLDTRPAFATVYCALARLGSVVVPLNTRLATETLRTQAQRAAVDLIVCGSETTALAGDVEPDGTPVASVDGTATDDESELDVRAVERPSTPSPEPVATAPDADRLVLFTSGTTGDPKGVRLTRRNLVGSAVGSAFRLGVDPGDRWLVCLPMYHMGGLAPLVRSTLYGTSTVIQREFDPDATATVMAERAVTGVSLVPTMLRDLLDAGWRPPDSLRFVLLGGAPASRRLIDRCLERDVPVYPTYGLTETASQVATATPWEAREHPDTVGRPLRNTTVTIIDGDDREDDPGGPSAVCEPGETGELVVDGPTVTPGYLDDDRTSAAFGERGFHTGDLGYADGEGRLWVVGRLDDAVVTGGENVHPARVSDALESVPGVTEAAVVGIPDERWGERVAALVVPTGEGSAGQHEDSRSLTAESVRSAVREQLADFAVPKTVAFAEELPRTHSGTVDRDAVVERLRDAAE